MSAAEEESIPSMQLSTRPVAERGGCIALTERDTLRVMALLENPLEPTPALLAAARNRAARK